MGWVYKNNSMPKLYTNIKEECIYFNAKFDSFLDVNTRMQFYIMPR